MQTVSMELMDSLYLSIPRYYTTLCDLCVQYAITNIDQTMYELRLC